MPAGLALGAQTTQLGTAFVACPESAADEGCGAHSAGQGAWMCRPMPAAALVRLLGAELRAAIAGIREPQL